MTRSLTLNASVPAFLIAVLGSGNARAQEAAPSVPPPPPAAPPVQSRAEVRFDADEPGIRVLTLGGAVPVQRVVGYRYGWWVEPGIAPVYRPLCREPCSARLVPGPYQLALARGWGGPVPAREPVVIQGPSVVHGTYVDRFPLRVAGWVIGIAGSAGGAVMIGVSARGHDTLCDSSGCYEHVHYDAGLLGGGVAVVVASLVVGSILVALHDEAHVTVQPLTLPASGALREAPGAALGSAAPPQGASVALHF